MFMGISVCVWFGRRCRVPGIDLFHSSNRHVIKCRQTLGHLNSIACTNRIIGCRYERVKMVNGTTQLAAVLREDMLHFAFYKDAKRLIFNFLTCSCNSDILRYDSRSRSIYTSIWTKIEFLQENERVKQQFFRLFL